MKSRTDTALADPFSAHEALDRAHLLSSIFSDFVADHPFIRAHPELRRRADQLAEGLGELYQIIGGLTLSTVLTLFVVPAFYAVFEDVKAVLRNLFGIEPKPRPGAEIGRPTAGTKIISP